MKEFLSVAEVYEAHLREAQEAEQLGTLLLLHRASEFSCLLRDGPTAAT
jgi:hypothetical protein